MNELFTIGEVARHLGVHYYRITYAHRAGLSEPIRVGGRRLYTFEDIERLERHFAREDGREEDLD